MSYECLKGCDGRKRGLLSDWEAWLTEADKLYDRFLARTGDSPFNFHEVASVGFLASAAAMAGFLPINEYDIVKRGKNDKRMKVPGRADLWFDAGKRCYSFEFKRAWLAATEANLSDSLDKALDDVTCIESDEYHYAAGCLLARVRDEHRSDRYETFVNCEQVDLAYRIGPPGVDGAYLFFALKD